MTLLVHYQLHLTDIITEMTDIVESIYTVTQ